MIGRQCPQAEGGRDGVVDRRSSNGSDLVEARNKLWAGAAE